MGLSEQLKDSVRDYQQEAVDCVLFGWEDYDRLLLRLATGGGKTVILAIIIALLFPKRCLYLADQDELVWQPAEAIDKWAGIIPAIEKANKRASLGAKIIVASSQTLSRPERLSRFPEDFFQYILIDEAHRGAERDRKIADYFPKAKVLGVTATPFNSQMRDLSKYYEHVAFDLPMLDLISLGYAPPIQIMTCPVEIDLAGVETTRGEYDEEGLSTTIEPYYDRIAQLMVEHASDRHSIVFLPLVAASKAFAAICRRHGLRAIHVDAQSPDRAEILERFRRGQYQVLCNAQVVETGVDLPIADCFVNLRPLRSAAKYQQGFGRCMRPLPGAIDGIKTPEERKLAIAASAKPNTLIIDFLWQHDDLGVMHPGHLYAKNEEEAAAIFERTKKVRTPEELQEIAQRTLREREEQLVRKLEDASVRDPSKLIDPMLLAHLIGDHKLLNYEPMARWEMDHPSDRQLAALFNWGIDTSQIDSKGLAAKVMDACMFRFKYRMAGPQQLRELHTLGASFRPTISSKEAVALIHEIKEAKRHARETVPV